MRVRSFFTALILLVATSFAYPQASQPIAKRSGSLYDLVERASQGQVRKDTDLFRVPTPGQIMLWRSIVENILAGRQSEAQAEIKRSSFPYQLFQFTERSNGREYIVLEETAPLQAGWGLYVFDPRSTNPLVIEAPHPVFDSRTEFEAIDAFVQTGATAYLLAGAHRRANKQITPCTQPKSSDESATYPVSDVAHSVNTPFQAVHESIVKLRPATVAVQLHGMTERPICPAAFVSTGTASVTTNSKKLLACLTKSSVDAEIYDGKTSCPLSALSNVQGRYSNGVIDDPCGTPASTSPEPGHFIHIEQQPSIRRDRASWQPVIDALKCAFPSASLPAEPAKSSFTFKSPDNPEITVFYHLPPIVNDKTKVVMVMAGRQRNADAYLESWITWAEKNNYLVLAPRFDNENWPEPLGYNFGNIASGKEASNTPNPKSKWAFTVIEELFSAAKERFRLKANDYVLFGHSAGGQFVHRFMLFMPDNHVRLAIAANPGFYTLPDLIEKFPYGVKNSPFPIDEKRLKAWAMEDLVIMRGTADIKRTENLRQTREADAQGKNRFERAGFMFGRIRGLEPRSNWLLVDVPGVAHDQNGMAYAAQKFLDEHK